MAAGHRPDISSNSRRIRTSLWYAGSASIRFAAYHMTPASLLTPSGTWAISITFRSGWLSLSGLSSASLTSFRGRSRAFSITYARASVPPLRLRAAYHGTAVPLSTDGAECCDQWIAAGCCVKVMPQLKVDQGITAAHTIFGKCFLDSEKCAHGIQALWCITMAGVKRPPTHRTVTRQADEPRLEIGDKIPIEEGVVGVVLARYTRYGDARSDLRHICRATARRRGTLIRPGRILPGPLYLGCLSIRRFPFRHLCRFCLRRSPLKSPPFLGGRDDPLQPLRTYSAFRLWRGSAGDEDPPSGGGPAIRAMKCPIRSRP
jgi:hypothetical protein